MAKALQNGNNSNDKSVATIQPLLTSEDMVSLPIEELLATLESFSSRAKL